MVRWMSPFAGAVDCQARCDPRPGGAFSLVMASGEMRREVSGAYVQVDRPRKLVFTWIGPLTNDVETLVTVDFIAQGDETELVLTHERLPTSSIVEGHTRGWGAILDHLAEAVPKDARIRNGGDGVVEAHRVARAIRMGSNQRGILSWG